MSAIQPAGFAVAVMRLARLMIKLFANAMKLPSMLLMLVAPRLRFELPRSSPPISRKFSPPTSRALHSISPPGA